MVDAAVSRRNKEELAKRPGNWASRLRTVLLLLYTAAALSMCSGGGDGGDNSEKSIARIWNDEILEAIRVDTPRPPVHARNLWHLSAVMYDAWAVYDPTAEGYLLTEKVVLPETEVKAARREAISFGAYRLLKNRYALSVNSAATLAAIDRLMNELGYDPAAATLEGGSAAAVGIRAAEAAILLGDSDGSNQAGNYADPSYTPVNPPLIVKFPGNEMSDPNAWQPLALDVAFTQNGLPQPSGVQPFVGSQWNGVLPFSLVRTADNRPYVDAGLPPRLGSASDAEFKSQMLELIEMSAQLSSELPEVIDISPASYGNNSLGADDGTGRPLNPATGEPYRSQQVKLGDFGRVLAEFWADGPKSETPPGHWNTIANSVSDSSEQKFLFEGTSAPLDRLEWDVKLYFTLNAALHDAAVNCWGTKRLVNSVRPISAIRYMATKGQSTDPSAPSYDPEGLPLVPGLSELITEQSWPAGRHAGIRCCVTAQGQPAPCVDSTGAAGVDVSCVGEVAVLSWPGSPSDPQNSSSGVKWTRAKEWSPYQLKTFVTPAFPGFSSGHSTFSRAAAEVLTEFTGSQYFPGGLGQAVFEENNYLTFESGPSTDINLQWATYYDAADQAGLSRRFGGIHIRADDYAGRIAGAQIGKTAFARAKSYFKPE